MNVIDKCIRNRLGPRRVTPWWRLSRSYTARGGMVEGEASRQGRKGGEADGHEV